MRGSFVLFPAARHLLGCLTPCQTSRFPHLVQWMIGLSFCQAWVRSRNRTKIKYLKRAYSSEMALNWAGASTNFFRILMASVITATKSPPPNPKLISSFQCENTKIFKKNGSHNHSQQTIAEYGWAKGEKAQLQGGCGAGRLTRRCCSLEESTIGLWIDLIDLTRTGCWWNWGFSKISYLGMLYLCDFIFKFPREDWNLKLSTE